MTSSCYLIYNSEDGFAWVSLGEFPFSDGETLESDENTKSRFPTLFAAYVEAAKRGHRPSHWVNMSGTKIYLPLDQADHWRKLAGIED